MTQNLRDFGNALVIALISISLMMGALSISLVEFVPEAAPSPTSVVMPSPLPLTATETQVPTSTFLPTATFLPGTETPTSTLIPTNTNVALTSTCPHPAGWGQISVQPYDTLDSLAIQYRVNRNDIKTANCLVGDNLFVNTILYVPLIAATSTVQGCVIGAAGWIKNYTVKPGDTIYAIATNYNTTATLLKSVNCHPSDLIYVGELLWVPIGPTRTPTPTRLPGSTITPHPTDPLTETALPFTVTPQPSNTPVPPTATTAPTSTSIPTFTPTMTAFP